MKKSTSRPLRFTHIHVENWRNFTRIEVDLQGRVFLAGPNASGKSNLLDLLRFLRDIVSVGGGFQEAVGRRGGVSRLRCLAARRYSDIAIQVHIGNDECPAAWVYEIRFNQDSRQRPILKEERVVKQGEVRLARPDEKDKGDSERLTETYLEQVNTNQAFRDVAEFFRTIRYLHIVPQLIREPDRSVGKTNDPFGGDFLEQIARTPEKTRIARLKRIREALRVAVPQLQELDLHRDERGVPHLRGKYEHWRPKGAWQNEDQFSDGTLRLMGLLWAAQDRTGPLLLEEPELSLHPDVVRFIPQMFARIQRYTGRQVFVSTHSTDMFRDDAIGLDEVLLLSPTPNGTSVQSASDFEDIKALLEGGVPLSEVVMPRTRPKNAHQLSLFGR